MDKPSMHERLASRITLMLIELFEKGSVSRRDLASRFNVSERTIYRDFNRLGAFVTCTKEGLYRIALPVDKEGSLPSLLSLSEMTGLQQLLPVSGDGPLKELLQAIEYKRIKIHLLPPETLGTEWQKKIFSTLDHAIKDKHICQVQYKNKLRTLSPYRLMNIKGIWYLAATDEDVLIKAYQLSLIEWIDVKKVCFIPDGDIHEYLDSEDDAWFSMNKVEVTVEVMACVAKYFERRTILPQQKLLEKTDKGNLIMTTLIAHPEQLFPILRFWLPNVRIISPVAQADFFIKQLTEHLAAMNLNPALNVNS